MSLKPETLVAIPAFVVLFLAINLAAFSFATADVHQKQVFVLIASGLFVGGVVFAVCWVIISVVLKVHTAQEVG